VLTAADQHVEQVMLGVRLADGLPAQVLNATERATAARLCDDGLTDPGEWRGGQGRVVLTLRGRLLADLVVRRLLWETDESLT
jgi:oxygen-independent coproporphyrinogen-3 oxidase